MKKKKKKQRIVFLTLTTESWILQSAILITTAIVDYAYVCRYDVMYVTRSVRQKEKIKKEKIIKYIGGERKALVEGSWIGATKLEVGFSRSSCPLGERSHGIRSLERNKGRVDPSVQDRVVAKVRFENRILQRFGTEIERISVYIRNGNLSR